MAAEAVAADRNRYYSNISTGQGDLLVKAQEQAGFVSIPQVLSS